MSEVPLSNEIMTIMLNDHTEPKPSQPEYIYFIYDETNDSVKIGRAKNVDKRLRALQTANPHELTILKTICVSNNKKAVQYESQLHNNFKHLNLKGEWFIYNSELQSYIEDDGEKEDSNAKTSLPRKASDNRKLKNIIAPINKQCAMFPTIRSLIVGQFLDEQGLQHIVYAIHPQDIGIIALAFSKKKNEWKLLSQPFKYGKPFVYISPNLEIEFHICPNLLHYLECTSSFERSKWTKTTRLVGLDIHYLSDLRIFSQSLIDIDDSLKPYLEILKPLEELN